MNGSNASSVFSSGVVATVTPSQGRQLVTLVGEFDECFTASGSALIHLVAEHRLPVDLDLSGLTFFSAAGVRWLVALIAHAGVPIAIVAASDTVRAVLELCGMDEPATAGSPNRYADSSA